MSALPTIDNSDTDQVQRFNKDVKPGSELSDIVGHGSCM